MTLSFASATGNYFNRIGKIGLVVSQLRTNTDQQLINLTNTSAGVVAQYNAEADLQALVGDSYLGLLADGGVGGFAQNLARLTINRMIFRDNPRINQDLTGSNITASITELIRQMRAAGATVRAHTITATPSSFTGTGNGIVVASTRRPLDGLVLENSYGETLLLTCTSDSYTGGATAFNEGFTLTGTGSQNDPFAFNWPLGSNATTTLNAIDGASDNASGNLLNNSGFEDFTGNAPDNWTIVTGAAGTHFFSEGSLIYGTSSTKALRILGDGVTAAQIRQQFDTSSGTSGELEPQSQYAVNLFMRRDGTAAAAGVLSVELVDSSFNVIQDNNSQNNAFTVDLTALTTNYASYSGVFRTPTIMPSTYYIRLRQSTALTNGRSVYLDKMGLGLMTQTYLSGPYIAAFSGSTRFVANDFATIPVTNSRGSGGTLNTFQTLFARLYFTEVYGSEFLLPSSSTPTISDSALIA